MTITVADALNLPILKDVLPVAGLNRLSNPIRWVHVMGVPEMAKWIRGGELLLSSGYLWPKRANDQCALVEAFASAGLSALALNVGEMYPEIPRHLVEAANSIHLPLLACPWTKPYVDIAEAIQREILRDSMSRASSPEAELARDRAAFLTERSLEDKLVVELLRGTLADHLDGVARASLLGLAPDRRHRVALAETHDQNDWFVARVRLNLAGKRLRPIVAALEGRLAMVFPGPDAEREDLVEILETLLNHEPYLLRPDARIALSQPEEGLEGIHRGYQQSLAALALGARFSPRERVLRYEELRTYRLLGGAVDSTALEEYVRDVLGPLARPTTRFEKELRQTIETLVEKQFSQIEAARALFLHKNSMRYRLRRIQEVTGLEVTRHDHSHQLQLAVEADRVLSGISDLRLYGFVQQLRVDGLHFSSRSSAKSAHDATVTSGTPTSF